jgi:hypothetical protein
MLLGSAGPSRNLLAALPSTCQAVTLLFSLSTSYHLCISYHLCTPPPTQVITTTTKAMAA